MKEHPIQNAIMRTFGSHPDIRLWRQNTGVGFFPDGRTGKMRKVRFGQPGQADLIGLVRPSGRWLEIEVKSETGRQTDDQKTRQRIVERMGGIYILARSVEDVWAGLAEHGVTLRQPVPVPPWRMG
jgi:hypothetical protein